MDEMLAGKRLALIPGESVSHFSIKSQQVQG
jgi:hypothetical protein